MTLANFVILALAAWRLSNLLVFEEGPFDVFVILRNAVGVKYDVMAEAYGTNVISKVFACIWCLSFWVAIGLSLLYLLAGDIAIWLCLPFALSGFAIIIHRNIE